MELPIGEEVDFEVFPEEPDSKVDDLPDSLPILFRITGLEEGKKYLFSIRSTLMKRMRMPTSPTQQQQTNLKKATSQDGDID